MIRIIFSTCFIFWFCSIATYSQPTLSTKNKKAIDLYIEADNFRVRGQFAEAISLLNQAIDKDKKFFEAYYRLGLVYLSKKDYAQAIQYYEKGLSLTSDPVKQKVFWYDLGDSYFYQGKYDEAVKYFSEFLTVEKNNKQRIEHANQVLKNVEFIKQGAAVAARYKLRPLSDTVNRFVLQYFPVLTADQQELIFTRRVGNNPDDDEDLVICRKDGRGRWLSPQSISPHINSSLNEGTSTISADGRLLIFTSCVGREGFGSCDLFESRKVGDDWSEPVNLGVNVNSSEWESQPSLSADGRTLYFVSDRRGSIGRRDIWVTYQNDKGQWTKAKNIGKPVNSVYDEMSPFIHVNNQTLYFASNGLTGFGGYDIFYSEKDTSNAWSAPVNIGAPINDHEDQFSLFITADGKKGYFAREESKAGGLSASKLYEVEIPEESQVKHRSNYVKGVIRDKKTKHPLAADVELINIEKNERASLVRSDSVTGQYLIVLTQGAEYALYVNKQGYLFTSENFNYSSVKDFKPIVQNIDLEPAKSGSIAILNNIFFEFDKYDLQEKSKTELQEIVKFLNNNPSLKVEIGGHTDNVGSVDYNQQLSEKRAKSVYDYLMKAGIAKSRLLSKGYGSKQPIVENTSEENRQMNRRIEFKILP